MELDWIQLEVTTRCAGSCLYCPRSAWGRRWVQRDVSWNVVRALEPVLAETGFVHLQGWGEPLLYPRFEEAVRLVKAAGCRVGTTTCGTQLDRDWAERLVDLDVDLVAVSVAGVWPATNNLVRRGTRFERVMRAVETFVEVRERRGVEHPRIHLAYMLLRFGLDEFDEIPERFGSLGVDRVVVSSLSFVPTRALLDEAVLVHNPRELAGLDERAERVRAEGKKLGLDISLHVANRLGPPGGCPENIERSLFIDSGGEVHACVLTGVPVVGPGEHWTWDGPRRFERCAFGSLPEMSIQDVWRDRRYERFRRQFSTGELWRRCEGCLKRWIAPADEEGESAVPMVEAG